MGNGRFARRLRDAPGYDVLPMPSRPVGNGEFVPQWETPSDRRIAAGMRAAIDAIAIVDATTGSARRRVPVKGVAAISFVANALKPVSSPRGAIACAC